jgi:hypothetical protein
MKNTDIKSILAADCGNATTTTVLIERVKGAYRLQAAGQAPSTHGPPWEDITVGIQEAARHIEKVVERTLLTPAGWPITPQNVARQGVDAFVVVSSAGLPLRVMLAGLIENISLASARRAVATTYTHITHIISLDAEGNIQQHSPEAGIQAIQEKKPEAILLAGGTDGGAEFPVIEMVRVISMAMQLLQDGEKPNILYAGNSKMRTHVADMLGPLAPLKSVSNVRPMLDIEDLAATQMELENLYVQRKMSRLPGFDKLSNWSEYPITPASKSFEKVIAYIGRHNNLNVLGVDIGSRSTMASSQTQQQLDSTIRSDAGIGHSLAALLEIVPIEQFHRWLPFELYPEELYNRLLNKSLYPTSIPTSYEDLMIEHAVAREALKLVVNQLRRNAPEIQWNLIIGAGRALTGTPQPAQAVMVMIDGIEPSGVTSLALDRSGVANMLGSIATVAPMAAVEVAAQDVFLNLGTIVAPLGHGQPDKPALKFKIEYAAEEPIEKEVPYGAIEMIPLPPGQKATLEIRPTRRFDIGLGQLGRGAVAEVEGGVLGIIVDARGRPLRLPRDDVQRQERLQQWLSALNVTYATSGHNN